MSEFGKRLKEAFNDAKDAEIARQLGVSQAAIKNYIDGRIPDAEKLLTISNLTNCSIHWLLTGEGEKNLVKITNFESSINDEIDYQKAADRIVDALKKSLSPTENLTERQILKSIHFPFSLFDPFRKSGLHGQLIYEILALRTNISLSWIVTGKGPMAIDDGSLEIWEIDNYFLQYLNDEIRKEIEKIAEVEGIHESGWTVMQTVNKLLGEALYSRRLPMSFHLIEGIVHKLVQEELQKERRGTMTLPLNVGNKIDTQEKKEKAG